MITPQQYFNEWNGKGIEGSYGYQCEDNAQEYNKEVVGGQPFRGNAIDAWTTYDPHFYSPITFSSGYVPQLGDIAVWGNLVGPYGHIAIVLSADSGGFTSFDQNWPIGSYCHFQHHGYHEGILGFLRPLNLNKMKLLDIYKFPNADTVFGTVSFDSFSEIEGLGLSQGSLHSYPGNAQLVKSADNDQVYMVLPIPSFDLSNPYNPGAVRTVPEVPYE